MLRAEFLRFEQQMETQYGVAAGEVYELAQIRDQLPGDPALVAWLDIKGDPNAADPNGVHWAFIVRKTGQPIWIELRGGGADGRWASDDDTLPTRVREAFTERASDFQSLADALYRQRIDPIEPHLNGSMGDSPVKQLIVLPAGLMGGVPIEALTDEYTIRYAPSASMFAWLREKLSTISHPPPASEGRSENDLPGHMLLALGDPAYAVPSDTEPEPAEFTPPPQGILLALVQPGSNADVHGLQRGDVLMKYDGKALETATDLGPSIKAAMSKKKEIPIQVWRAGKTLDLMLSPGRMGVDPAQGPASEAVLAMRRMDDALVRSGGSSFQPLPGTRKEVQAILALFGESATILLGSDASEQKLAELAASGQLKQYRYLHLAAHGVLDDKRAMNSALILAQDDLPDSYEQVLAGKESFDGRLTAKQIVRTWKLDADLVVLSACQTALGKRVGGEGFLGFSQALFVAGARSIVLSLWKVNDVSTSILMQEFYRNLIERKMTKAHALREAKRTLRDMSWEEAKRRSGMTAEQFETYAASRGLGEKVVAPKGQLQPPYAHPYYWAPFILIGDPE